MGKLGLGCMSPLRWLRCMVHVVGSGLKVEGVMGERVLKEDTLPGSGLGVGRSLDEGNCGVGVEVNWGILN